MVSISASVANAPRMSSKAVELAEWQHTLSNFRNCNQALNFCRSIEIAQVSGKFLISIPQNLEDGTPKPGRVAKSENFRQKSLYRKIVEKSP